jgi:hypothetical protein
MMQKVLNALIKFIVINLLTIALQYLEYDVLFDFSVILSMSIPIEYSFQNVQPMMPVWPKNSTAKPSATDKSIG